MRRVALSFCCFVALVAPIPGAGAKQPSPAADDCTWGASSMAAELVDGRWVESKPETSGCVPPR